jgi:hypothetical protein
MTALTWMTIGLGGLVAYAMGIGIAFRLLGGKRMRLDDLEACLLGLFPFWSVLDLDSYKSHEATMRWCLSEDEAAEKTNARLTEIAFGWPSLAIGAVMAALWRLTKLLARPLASVARLASGETMRRLRERE